MTARIIPLRRDLLKELAAALAFGKDVDVDELLARHGRVMALHEQALDQMDAGTMSPEEADEVVSASHHLDGYARRAGVDEKVVDAFNARRTDWKAWDAYRMTLPPYLRM